MNILSELKDWFYENRDRFHERGIEVKLIECKPTDNTALYFDVDTETIVARATVWESKEINFEAIEVESSKEIIAENHRANDNSEVLQLLYKFIDRIK